MKQKEVNEKLLESIMADESSKVFIKSMNKVVKIKWIRRGCLRKISSILNCVKEGEYEDTVTSRCAAAYILNDSPIKMKLFHWALWRILWRKCSDEELQIICEEAKKKVQVKKYYEIMILQTGLKDTLQQMTREEVKVMLRERQSAQQG